MRVAFIEIQNFRKLKSVRIELSDDKTIFVGANNSGKTTAIVALRRFLIDQKHFDINDFTVTNWRKINDIGKTWEADAASTHDMTEWDEMLPALDVWLDVKPNEIHYVQHLLPTLEWNGGLLGVRLRLEPTKLEALKAEYVALRQQSDIAIKAANKKQEEVPLWPNSMKDFLERGFASKLRIRSYILDPEKLAFPEHGIARPQALSPNVEASEDNPFSGLIRIDEINAQRGFSDAGNGSDSINDGSDETSKRSDKRKLSDQLRAYYARHLDPTEMPDVSDIEALSALFSAQGTFDQKLQTSFANPLKEIQSLGYPGVADPTITISTQIKMTDGLNHPSAIQYEINPEARLPEQYNGLGYQNLISMAFRLKSFRDEWMQVGKVGKRASTKPDGAAFLPPLHLVLVEEPEAHLHVQVQQVFIRKAYEILRNHDDLKGNTNLTTQLIVSTHSSHIAHECEFSCLRYFRRKPAESKWQAPISAVINLSEVFGKDDTTAKFVARYLKASHCDLFFADAAILIEGSAERMLLPHFIKKYFPKLDHRYLTILEVGGSHAHRFKPLIEHLGLTTLIITDIDIDSAGQKTQNPTLKMWLPNKENKSDLLSSSADDKTFTSQAANFFIRVAYQTAIKIILDPTAEPMSIEPNTFEDALVYANIDIFKTIDGDGLIKKFSTALKEKKTSDDLRASILEAIKNSNSGAKAKFALDLLFHKDPQDFAVPSYIEEGLKWLEEQITRCEIPPIENDNAKPPVQEAA